MGDALRSALCRLLTYDLVGAFRADPDGAARLQAYANHVGEPIAACYRRAAVLLTNGG